jgi:predicted Zn-dependent protease with MMP-like domain
MSSRLDWSAAAAPSLDDLAALAERAYAALPENFRKLVGDVVFQVADFADEDVLEELGIEDPFELTGLYQGVSLAHRSVLDPSPSAAMVFLYRRPILDEWAERGDLALGELVGHVLVHEIGHHFGLSDEDIHRVEDSASADERQAE